MAGDWIKVRLDLNDDPAVVGIAAETELGEDAVVGRLIRLWGWADRHSQDGVAPGITALWVDRYVGHSGFANAVVKAGWLEFNDSGIVFPNFDKHNSESAKKRDANAARQRGARSRHKKVTPPRDIFVTRSRTIVPEPIRHAVMERDNYTCVYCGSKSSQGQEASRKAKLSINHIIPEARDGKTNCPNLVCCCRLCNAKKADLTPEEWGILPTFLQDGVTYSNGSVTSARDNSASKARPEKRREESKKDMSTCLSPEKKQTSRKPNILWDTIVKLWHKKANTKTQQTDLGRLVREFKGKGAETEADLANAKDLFKAEWPDMPPTVNAVLKHYEFLTNKDEITKRDFFKECD